MPDLRTLRLLLLPLALGGALVVLQFSQILLQQALHKDFGEGVMMVWVLLFVTGASLPLILGSAAGDGRPPPPWRIIPSLGVKIP